MTADRAVVSVCAGALLFIVGYEIGVTARPCPPAEGMTPIASSSKGHEQVCIYVKATGKATHQVKF